MPAASQTPGTLQARLALGTEPGGLQQLATFVHDFTTRAQLPAEIAFAVDLALTEWITNVRDYGIKQSPAGRIDLELTLNPGSVEAIVQDNGPAFDPLARADVDINTPLDEKPIGGLGIHMVRKFMDHVSYQRVGDLNCLHLTKVLPPPS